MLLHVKNFSTYIQYVFVPKISTKTEKFQLHNHKLIAVDIKQHMFYRAYGNVKTVMQCKCPEQNRFRAMITILQMGVSQFC